MKSSEWKSLSRVWLFVIPWNVAHQAPLSMEFSRPLSLLQGIFPTQGSNPALPHCRQILYQLSHKGTHQAGFGRERCRAFPTLPSTNCCMMRPSLQWGFPTPPSLLSYLREIEGPSIPTCILGFRPFPPVINVRRAFENLSQRWKLQPATRVCTRGGCIFFFFFFPAKPELAGMGMNKRGDLKLHGLEGSSG